MKLISRFAVGLCTLLTVLPAGAQVRISEFMASNSRTLTDETGSYEDWIEIQNTNSTIVNLEGWSLTDSSDDLRKWTFPATNINPGAYMVVFASDKDLRVPGLPLHTNFKLKASGQYLALVRPDGSIATEFKPVYPGQLQDVSFGFAVMTTNYTLLAANTTVRVLVPTIENGGSSQGLSWTGSTNSEPFADSGWVNGASGAGFSEAGAALVAPTAMVVRLNFDAAPVANVITDTGPVGTSHPGQNNNAIWSAADTDASPAPRTRGGVMLFNASTPSQILLPVDSEFDGNKGTITFWMRSSGTTGTGSEGAMIIDRRTSRGDVIVQHNNGTIFVQANDGAGTVNSFESASSPSDNRWHHIAYVYDQTSSGYTAIYIDGVLSRQQNTTRAWSWPVGQRIEIGVSHDGYWRKFNGVLDDFRVYNRVLSVQEINAIYAGDDGVNPADIGLNLQTAMLGVNSSAYLRALFQVDDPTSISLLTLKLRYDDGYVAWINGKEVGRANAPESLAWNSCASSKHPASVSEVVQIGAPSLVLRPGTNILAIQGLNIETNDPTFLLLPELTATTVQGETPAPTFMTAPTPGGPNVAGARIPGPIISEAQHVPAFPVRSESLLVTARVTPAFFAVSNVALHYRIMFNSEVTVKMYDDGAHGDGLAGDKIFAASIPANAATNGQMVRYCITATDVRTNASRWPLFYDPSGSAEYLGTMINPTNLSSQLPIFHLFVAPANLSGVDSETGSRASLFYDGELYDNIYMELRGGTTAGYAKKSHRLEFNREHPFRHPGPGGRVRKTSITSEYVDPTYLRQHLSFWLQSAAGGPAPFHYPVRLQLNGTFYQLGFHTDVLDEEQLERLGYDPNGALYKNVGQVIPSNPEKKTRTWEGNSDYNAMASAIRETNPLVTRQNNLFDIFDVPEIINYLACARISSENDDVWANMSVYRDSDGDGLWRILPYDMNLSWGQTFYGDNPSINGVIQATLDTNKSHPLYGGQPIMVSGMYNRIYDVVVQSPVLRQMLLRRMRSVMDRFLQPPETAATNRLVENYVSQMTNQIWVEAFLDRQRWGWPPIGGAYGFGPNQWLTNGVANMIDQFVLPRRTHLFVTHCVTNTGKPIALNSSGNAGIPTNQPADAIIWISGFDYNPASANQAQEYVCFTNPNPYAVDLTGWRVSGGIEFTFKPGTVVASNSTLYLSPDVAAFRSRTYGPRGGQGLLVVGSYQGKLNAWGEVLSLTDDRGRLVTTNGFPGTPSLPQRYLRITEIMYNPAPLAGSILDPQDFEYVELKNTSTDATLDLNGVYFTNGIAFSFAGSAVTSLAPGETVLVVRSTNAFAARYGNGFNLAGQYSGSLDNGGETLRLDDASGEKILEFAYKDSWYPLTDGLGFSLVIVNELAAWDTWGLKASWRASGAVDGSPGGTDPSPLTILPVMINELLSRGSALDADTVELYNPSPLTANLSGWFLTDDFNTPKKHRIPNGTVLAPGGYLVLGEAQFNPAGLGFAFGADGDEVWLFSGDTNTNLTGFYHGFSFEGSALDVSFGRYVNSQREEDFVAQAQRSPGAANSLPLVGPVVISEIMYHPMDLDSSENFRDEFIELQNITGTNVPLYDLNYPTNTWRLRDAVDFNFPPGLSLGPNERLLVVGFDPVIDNQALNAFRSAYNLDKSITILGPWQGKLNNADDRIELKRPDFLNALSTFYIVVEAVHYRDTAPWPDGADGEGSSLQRLVLGAYGNDPTNWVAAGRSPGQANVIRPGPVVSVTAPTNGAVVLPGNPVTVAASASVTSGSVVRVELFIDGAKVGEALGDNYAGAWTATPGAHILIAKSTDELGFSGYSSPVTVFVPQATTSTVTAVSSNALWRYLDDGSDQGSAWKHLNYSDNTWSNGWAELGYGDAVKSRPEATVIRYGTNLSFKWITYYFHKSFVLDSTNDISGAMLGIVRDDGAVAYLNGVEVYRNNMPGAPIGYLTTAATNVTGPDEYTFIATNVPASVFLPGTNILAVEVHQYSRGSSDLSFDAELKITETVMSPLVMQSPASQSHLEGETAVLSVTAIGSGPLVYQWYANGVPLSSGTNSVLVLSGLTTSQAGAYIVVITNMMGVAMSDVATLTVLANPDSDGDGMPDAWEVAYGTNPYVPDANADPDQDNMTNFQEYLAGTEPTNASSVLRIRSIAWLPGTEAWELEIPVVSNRSYSVLYRETPGNGGWLILTNLPSTPTNRIERVVDPAETPRRFYRIVTPP